MGIRSDCSSNPTSGGWFRYFRKKPVRPLDKSPDVVSLQRFDAPVISDHSEAVKEAQQTAASTLSTGTSRRSLVLSMKCHGIIGVVRFLLGYYLILITKCRQVAQIGEHKIFKVEDTHSLYIPGNEMHSCNAHSVASSRSSTTRNTFPKLTPKGSSVSIAAFSETSRQTAFQQYQSSLKQTRVMADEVRYLKLFNSINMASNFYFSYTYDLSHSLQYNMRKVSSNTCSSSNTVRTVKPVPNDRFVWNWRLIPPHFRPTHQDPLSDSDLQPDWFIPLYNGIVLQAALSACGAPFYLTLIGRRSRRYAGTRFLKRGINLVGDVANEVETEQIVHDASHIQLHNSRCSSYVQLRGSVPLFWSQESGKLVGRPPIELLREDPLYEAFGLHFSDLLSRYGSPIVVLNLMKMREKRPFEQILSEGYERGLVYLSQFLPSHIPIDKTATVDPEPVDEKNPPIVYIAFDIARVQKSKRLVALDQLTPVVDTCVRRTGIFISSFNRRGSHRVSSGVSPHQCGVIRTNCIDCLDRTNTAQFVVGRVALAYQLHNLGFISEPVIVSDSKIDRLLQNLYDEHGDTLALQYGGSQLVHNIDTYKKTHKLSSQSRDLVQTLSRFYSNKFSDWDKQCVTNLFLRVYRPCLWTGTLFDLVCKEMYHQFRTRASCLATDGTNSLWASAWELDPINGFNLLATLSELAVSADGPLWDLPNDAHLHWLDAWSRLPLSRSLLTDWCPRPLLDSLPFGLDLIRKSELLASRCMELPPDDIRVNWFAELYEPSWYQTIDRNALPHMRSVELPIQIRSSDALLSAATPSLGFPNASMRDRPSFPKHHSFSNPPLSEMPEPPQSPATSNTCTNLANTRDSVQSASSPSKFQKRRMFNPSSTDEIPAKSRSTISASSNGSQTVSKRQNKSRIALKKISPSAQIAKEDSGDESSSDSDSAESTGGFLRVYPPTLNLTQSATMGHEWYACSDPPPNPSLYGSLTHKSSVVAHSMRRLESEPVQSNDLWDWADVYSPYDPVAMKDFLTPTDADSYRHYLNPQRFSMSASDTTQVKSSSVVTPSSASIDTYRYYANLGVCGECTVPAASIALYKATVLVADALRC
ncbi:unnamed protein product [Dicrocoelium dendriticum]|nr:unnamed protein product [Dicrocoelium dendriticum]